MSTLALRVDRAAAGRARASALLRGPFPAWAALFANVLAFSGLPTVVPIPGTVGQLVTQGALVLAFLLALLANPGGVVRPSLFLVLLTMLATVALMVSIHNEFVLGSTFRACRLIGFTLVLWLLTPWWGRPDFVLLRAHLTCLRIVLALGSCRRRPRPRRCVLLRGSAVGRAVANSPDTGGPLRGRPARVHRRAVVRRSGTRSDRLVDASRGGSGPRGRAHAHRPHRHDHRPGRGRREHVHGPCPSPAHICAPGRARRDRGHLLRTADPQLAVARADVAGGCAAHRADQGVVGHLRATSARGWKSSSDQDCPTSPSTASRSTATGSPSTWTRAGSACSSTRRSSWFLILLAVTHRRGIRRAVALFLVTYCLVASITETGLGDASPYLLNLVVAASLLAAPAGRGRR